MNDTRLVDCADGGGQFGRARVRLNDFERAAVLLGDTLVRVFLVDAAAAEGFRVLIDIECRSGPELDNTAWWYLGLISENPLFQASQ